MAPEASSSSGTNASPSQDGADSHKRKAADEEQSEEHDKSPKKRSKIEREDGHDDIKEQSGEFPHDNCHKIIEDLKSQVTQLQRKVATFMEGLSCSICLDLLDQPVELNCSHMYCSKCLYAMVTRENGMKKHRCPLCRVRISSCPKPPALAFLQLFEKVTGASSKESSREHKQHLDYFADLFKTQKEAFYDDGDAVYRCPTCHWELVDGACGRCDFVMEDHSEDEHAEENSSEGGEEEQEDEDDEEEQDEEEEEDDSFIDNDGMFGTDSEDSTPYRRYNERSGLSSTDDEEEEMPDNYEYLGEDSYNDDEEKEEGEEDDDQIGLEDDSFPSRQGSVFASDDEGVEVFHEGDKTVGEVRGEFLSDYEDSDEGFLSGHEGGGGALLSGDESDEAEL